MLVTAAIAVLPGAAWWFVAFLFTDPDEGANIGAGLVLLAILPLSWLVAVVFLVVAFVRRHRLAR